MNLLTIQTAAERLAISERQVYRLIADGRLAVVNLGARCYRIRPEDLDRMVRTSTHLIDSRRLDHPFDRRLQFRDVPIPRGAVRQAAAEPFLAGFVAGTARDGGGGGLDLGPHRDGHRGRVTRGRWGGAGCEQGRERYRPAWRGHGIRPVAG